MKGLTAKRTIRKIGRAVAIPSMTSDHANPFRKLERATSMDLGLIRKTIAHLKGSLLKRNTPQTIQIKKETNRSAIDASPTMLVSQRTMMLHKISFVKNSLT